MKKSGKSNLLSQPFLIPANPIPASRVVALIYAEGRFGKFHTEALAEPSEKSEDAVKNRLKQLQDLGNKILSVHRLNT